MVDTVGVKIILHLGEATAPPVVVILRHHIPVIGREAPVLASGVEVIGRCTGGGVQVEQLGLYGSIHRVGRDADGYITLHRYADAVGVCNRFAQLAVGVVLQVVVELLRLTVALVQELGIGLQPTVILLYESLIIGTLGQFLEVTLVQRAEINHLGVIHVLIVGYILGIECSLLLLVFLLQRGAQFAHTRYIYIYRV